MREQRPFKGVFKVCMKSNEHIDKETWILVKKVAKNIKTTRKQKGLTQMDMSEFGFGPRWYQRLESGRHIPTVPTLHRLAMVFEIEITELFK